MFFCTKIILCIEMMPIKLQWTALDVIKCLIIWQMFSNAIPTRILRFGGQIRYSFSRNANIKYKWVQVGLRNAFSVKTHFTCNLHQIIYSIKFGPFRKTFCTVNSELLGPHSPIHLFLATAVHYVIICDERQGDQKCTSRMSVKCTFNVHEKA